MSWFKKKKPDKWGCKWIVPSEGAWWEWQSCANPEHPYQQYSKHPGDFTCNFEKDCTCYEEGKRNWKLTGHGFVEKEKK